MPLSNPVIRRYTPPTCTLEVLAQSSPLSKLMGKSVLKDLRFELRLDDPRLPEEGRIAIRGDRDQLEALHAAVSDYVQEFIHKSPENFGQYYSQSNRNDSLGSDAPTVLDSSHKSSQTNTIIPFNKENSRNDIHLQPGQNLTHNLFLGSLASHTSAPIVQLSLLQLFDLATALDEYSADVMALPNLNTGSMNTGSRGRGIPTWAPMAAVAAAAIALIPVTYQHANRVRLQEQTAKKSVVADEKIALQPQTEPSPQVSPNSSFPSALPTPPGVANSQLGNPNLIPGATPGSPNFVVPPGATTPGNPNVSTPGKATTQNPANSPIANSGDLFTGVVPGGGQPIFGVNPTNSGKLGSPNTIATGNNGVNSRSSTGGNVNIRSGKVGQTGKVSSNRSGTGSSTTGIVSNSLPPSGAPITLAPIPSEISSASSTQSNQRKIGTVVNSPNPTNGNKSPLVDRLRQGRKPGGGVVAANNSGSNDSLFDTPQVAEARVFLKKSWRPPAGLKEDLQYSLIVGVDGSLESIIPLGKASRDNIELTGIPRPKKPFVSSNRNGRPVRIRAIFSPDGQVKTLPESE
jgi:hypothetical protein